MLSSVMSFLETSSVRSVTSSERTRKDDQQRIFLISTPYIFESDSPYKTTKSTGATKT